MVSVIQAAKQNIQKDSNDSPCYGPLKTADQMLNPANKFFPVGLVILKQFKIGKLQWHPNYLHSLERLSWQLKVFEY